MTSIQETIEQKRKDMIPGRLLKGAKVLGDIFREGQRCTGNWSRDCWCQKRTDFCEAKSRWLELLRELAPPEWLELTGNDPHFIILCMNEEMLNASGLTLKIQGPPGLPPILIGKKGTFFQTLIDIIAAAPTGSVDQGSAWMTVVQVQEQLR